MIDWFLHGAAFAAGSLFVLLVSGSTVAWFVKARKRRAEASATPTVAPNDSPSWPPEVTGGPLDTPTGQADAPSVLEASLALAEPSESPPTPIGDSPLDATTGAASDPQALSSAAAVSEESSLGPKFEQSMRLAVVKSRRLRRELVSVEVLAWSLVEDGEACDALIALGVDRPALLDALEAAIQAQPAFGEDVEDAEPLPTMGLQEALVSALKKSAGRPLGQVQLLSVVLERGDSDAAHLLVQHGVTLGALQAHGPLPDALTCIRAIDLQRALPLPSAVVTQLKQLADPRSATVDPTRMAHGPQVLALADGLHAEEHQAVPSIARAMPTHRPLRLVARSVADLGSDARRTLLQFLRTVQQPTLLWISDVGPLFTEPDNNVQAHARQAFADLMDALSPGPMTLTLVFTFDALYAHGQRMRRASQDWLEMPWPAPHFEDRQALIAERTANEPDRDGGGEDWRLSLAEMSEGLTLGDLDALLRRARRSARLADTAWPDLVTLRVEHTALRRQRIGTGMQQGAGQRHTASTARVQVSSEETEGLDAMAGLESVKAELLRFRALIMDRARFVEAGCRVPRGLLLQGPPGVGKTAIARAFAATLGRPFFSLAGSEFVELYVGVGAARVRDLFRSARTHQPCVIFIDELDAIGARRDDGGHNREQTSTLNQLLVELDGFDVNDGVFVMAATNRVGILDEALIRAGRFDNRIHIPLPDEHTRKAILLKLLGFRHSIGEADLAHLVAETEHWSGAEIENVINRARIDAVRSGGNGHVDPVLLLAAHQEVANSRRNVESDEDYDERF